MNSSGGTTPDSATSHISDSYTMRGKKKELKRISANGSKWLSKSLEICNWVIAQGTVTCSITTRKDGCGRIIVRPVQSLMK